MMNSKTLAVATALTFGISGLAFAQSSSTSPKSPPPASGSATTTQQAPSSSSPSTTSPSSPSATSRSTAGSGSTNMTEADVKQKLESQGYSNVTDIKKDKDGYTAKAMKG